jgi:hypothetical protein
VIYANAFRNRAEQAFFRPSPDLLRRIYPLVLEEGISSGDLVKTGRINRLKKDKPASKFSREERFVP